MSLNDKQTPPTETKPTKGAGRNKLPRWVRVFLIVDLSLVLIISFVIAYIYLVYYIAPSTIGYRQNSSKLGTVATWLASNPFKSVKSDIDNSIGGGLFKSQHLPMLFNRSNSRGVDKNTYGEPELDFYGIDFSQNQLRIIITITPPDNSVNQGKPIVIPVFPAQECEFGDKTACVRAYKPNQQGNVIFLSVHSGVGGEAQRFRHAIEGTGINQASYDLGEVMARMSALNGAEVTIQQDDVEISGFKLVTTGRVPANSLQYYFDSPVTEALYQAASFNPGLIETINPVTSQLVIETCGWKMPGEPWAPQVTQTSASIYLGVIQSVD